MATFTNRATLSYTGGTVESNTVTGELLEVLGLTKTAITAEYQPGDTVTYALALRNTGTTALSGLSLTDNLGAYLYNETTLYPLSYVNGSVTYYVNGVLQPAPTVSTSAPLTITGLTVPADGNALLIYEATVNDFAPPAGGAEITNTATVSGGGIATPVTASEAITVASAALLTINKGICPATVVENGQITYTFVIENIGNTPAELSDNVIVQDTFAPILNPISVTYNGDTWTAGTNYTYNASTGEFVTNAGQITVPAATYTQNPDGTWTTVPGVTTLVVTGTV